MAASGLEELQLSRDEVERFSRALRDEKFRQLLGEYAEEISKPENKKKYEEEITQLERERGVEVKFVHPSPGHVLKSSAGGDKKCFVNVCSNELINKPSCQAARATGGGGGAPGQHWALPYSLTPAREDVGPGGRKHLIYDVVFHPDTLYMADRNKRFRKMVDGVALDAVEKQLDAKLDMKNVKTLKMKYKGLPHAAVIRTPLPGGAKEIPEQEGEGDGPFKFPYPYDLPKSEDASRSEAKENSTTERSNAAGKDTNKKTPESKFTQPKYSIVYRSTFDMQDYRHARDAVPSTRPKQLVVTIHLPLLNSAESACLDVTEKLLCLESQKPAYKLDLALPYPVDENQGSAKFNKSKRQLVVTLPVIPAKPELEVENNHNGDFEPARKDSDSMENEPSLLNPALNQVEDCIQKNTENDTARINSEDGCEDSNWDPSQNKEHLEVSHIAASDVSGIKVTPSISCPNDVIVSEVDSDGHQNLPEEAAVSSRDNICMSLENRSSSTEDGQTNEHSQVNSSANAKCGSEGSLKESEPVCPDFHSHQDESTVTFILLVRNIKENSLTSVLQTHDYHISFGTTDSDSLYSLIIQFPSDYQLNTEESVLNVSEDNAVVVLIKSLESRGLWQSFCAGHTYNSLQNKLFVTSENADQFLSTSLKDSVPNDAAEECSAELSVSEVHESGLVISCKFQQQENDEINSDARDLNHSTPCSTPSNTQQHGEEIHFTESIASDRETEKETSLADDGVECVPSQRDELATLSGNCDHFAQLHGSSEGSVIIPTTQMDALSLSSCMNPADEKKLSVCAKVEAGNDELLDEDDLISEQMDSNDPKFVKQMAPLQILEEVNPTDKSMEIIYDHTTHSAFTFQNPELFQLD